MQKRKSLYGKWVYPSGPTQPCQSASEQVRFTPNHRKEYGQGYEIDSVPRDWTLMFNLLMFIPVWGLFMYSHASFLTTSDKVWRVGAQPHVQDNSEVPLRCENWYYCQYFWWCIYIFSSIWQDFFLFKHLTKFLVIKMQDFGGFFLTSKL